MSECQSPAKRKRDGEPAFQFMKQHVNVESAPTWEALLQRRRVVSLVDLRNFINNWTKEEETIHCSSLWSPVTLLRTLDAKISEDTEGQSKDMAGEWLSFTNSLPNTSAIHIETELVSKDSNLPILIMGSSGSGKSTFAVKVLPFILERLDSSRAMFFVYMLGSHAFNERRLSNEMEVGDTIYNLIDRELKCHGANDAQELKMVVVIDEVGIKEDARYLDTRSKLDSIQGKLSGLARNVQLVLVGTGLDQITCSLNSNQEVFKVRMTPWSRDLVDKYIHSTYSQERGKALKDLIWSTHLYRRLSSNPRSLRFLTETLNDQLTFHGPEAVNADFVVAQVTDKYIRANSLADLKPNERRVVVMIVWKALSEAEKGAVKLPDLSVPNECKCDEGREQRLEACCYSLVDIHLETKGDKIALVKDHDYAVSITSALSLVLVALTGNVACLCRNWDQFELVAALHELQVSYIQKHPEAPPPIKILVSRALFPGKEKDSVRVPCVAANRIVVNGPRAQYCDVMSFGRLVQAKHVEDPTGAAKIDLDEELGKAGVLKPKPMETSALKQRTLTALLRMQWDGHPTGEQHSGKISQSKACHPPFLPDGSTRHGSAVSKLCVYANEPQDRLYYEAKMISESIEDQKCPISVVFITNAKEFKISRLKGTSMLGTDIQRQHVDKDGTLTQSLPANVSIQKEIDALLLSHVSVKFYFLQQDGSK